MGVRRFVFMRGILAWGIPVGVTVGVTMNALTGYGHLIARIITSLAAFCFVGFVRGHLDWEAGERRYKQLGGNP